MSGLYSTLDASVSALNAQSVAINTTGNNLANVNNANYAREVVNFGSLGTVDTSTGPESMGLTALSVTQDRSAVLDSQVRDADSQASYYTTQQNVYNQAQAALGQTVSSSTSSGTASSTSDSGVGSALDDFFNAFQSLAANPSDSGAQQTVVQAASILTDRLQSSDANLAQVQSGADEQVASDVTTANTLLGEVAGLNTQIGRLEINDPGAAVDLRDQREGDLEQLAGLMPVTVTEGSNGEDTITAAGSTGSAVTLVSGSTVTGPVTFDGTSVISAGSPATALALSGGTIQGGIDASTGGIQTLRDSLNAIANELVTSVNGAYNPTGTGNNFFNSSNTTAGTISLDPTLTASNVQSGVSGDPGDNSIALAVANLAGTTFSTSGGDSIDGTFDSYYDGAVTGFGQTLSGVNDQATDTASIQTLVTNQRQSVSGVNLDEEMSNLLMYQRSYQASAQVFQTVDSLLDAVVNTLGTVTT
jgi:flagellar hook-associated protein 1 FlgK